MKRRNRRRKRKIGETNRSDLSGSRGRVPVSLEYRIGGGRWVSAKWRCLGYLFLLNRCSTMQMRPASTAMPDVTPSNVGRSEVMTMSTGGERKREGEPCELT